MRSRYLKNGKIICMKRIKCLILWQITKPMDRNLGNVLAVLMLMVTASASASPPYKPDNAVPSEVLCMSALAKDEVTVPLDSCAEVLLETTEGNIRIALYNETPCHRDNFLKLVAEHFYDSLLFHRIIPDYIVQTGSSDSRYAEPGVELGESDLGYRLKAEIRTPEIRHRYGSVAAAREADDVNPDRLSDAAQFYIVTRKWGVPKLDGAYTVFGQVVEGMDIVKRISRKIRDDNDRPVYDVRILHATIIRNPK